MPYFLLKESLIMPKEATVVVDLSEKLEVWAYYKWFVFFEVDLFVFQVPRSSIPSILSFSLNILYLWSDIDFSKLCNSFFRSMRGIWCHFAGSKRAEVLMISPNDEFTAQFRTVTQEDIYTMCTVPRTIEFSIALNSWSFSVRWAAPQTNTLP